MRLQRFLSQAGIASRRKAEELIKKGEVRVNQVVVRELGTQVDVSVDEVRFEGRVVRLPKAHEYWIAYKPRLVIVSKSDPEGRKTIYDFFSKLGPSVRAVGRLDYDSEGLIVLTNDGEFAYQLTHPSFEIKKTYEIALDQAPSREQIRELENGIELEDGFTAPAKIRRLQQKNGIWFRMQIHEGKNRQVRRMFEWAGCRVLRLIRTAIGPYTLGDLKVGQCRQTEKLEIG